MPPRGSRNVAVEAPHADFWPNIALGRTVVCFSVLEHKLGEQDQISKRQTHQATSELLGWL
jgi:hypothetical protein